MSKVVSLKISFVVPDNTSKFTVREQVEKVLSNDELLDKCSTFQVTGMEVTRQGGISFKDAIKEIQKQTVH